MSNDKKDEFDIKENEIAKKIKQSGQEGNVQIFSGYVVHSDIPENIRLYLNLTFDVYVEIPKKEIIHITDPQENILPFGGVLIWISKDTEITYGEAEIRKKQAKFLQGKISAKYLQARREAMNLGRMVQTRAGGSDPRVCTPIICDTDLCSIGCPTRTWDSCCDPIVLEG